MLRSMTTTTKKRSRESTLISLPPDLKLEAKVAALKNRTNLSHLIERLLREHLATGARVPKGAPKA